MWPVSRFGFLALAVSAPAFAQTADPAVAPVQQLSDGLIAIMKNGKAPQKAREDRIAPVVDRVFDMPMMTRLAVGPSWTTMTPTDKTALVASFRHMTISQYALNFNGYTGEAFVVDAKAEVRGTDRLVKTKLTVPKGAPVSLGYRLRQAGSDWRIIDVFYQNAISQLATRRADFAAVLARGGAKSLIQHIDKLATKAAAK